ncbi:MAG: TPM domain-containing protein [Pseudomonadota bacterium]
MRTILFLALLWPCFAVAQSYPDYKTTTVNDLADLLDETQEAELRDQLVALRRETGVEMTVLALESQSPYAPTMTLEQFATGLFNHWGIGDAKRNDGVLVMVLSQDRAMRVELGAAYARDWDGVAQRVVDEDFLPDLRNDRFAAGILNGSKAVEANIVRPFLAGDSAPASSKDDDFWIFSAIFGAGVLIMAKNPLSNVFARVLPCPNCGRRGMRQSREVVSRATRQHGGRGLRRRRCPHCGHENETSYFIPRISSGGSGGFGGGRSGGGGASGRF